MIYKIIVDKQPMSNPSEERKEYEIDIAPLYFKHDVYDSLVITHDEDYVMRRLELQDYNVLVELDPPVKEPLTDINIELFEGDNYIYLYDMAGNKIVAQYLVKNEFNELYVLESTMNSAINQKADEIELYVGQYYETIEHATSEYARIDLNAQGISTEVSKKVGNNEVISKINQSAEAVTINANKISLAGKTINMTSDNIAINSTNFNVDKNGTMTCTNANVTGTITSSNVNVSGGQINLTDNSNLTNAKLTIQAVDVEGSWKSTYASSGASFSGQYGAVSIDTGKDVQAGVLQVRSKIDSNNYTIIQNGNINCISVTQRSLESAKKGFEKLSNGLDIIKNIDIYKYNMKNEDDDTKKHIGFVIGDNYKYSKEVTSNENDGVDLYSFVSVCCKAIQEQQEEIQELKERIEKLEKGDK